MCLLQLMAKRQPTPDLVDLHPLIYVLNYKLQTIFKLL